MSIQAARTAKALRKGPGAATGLEFVRPAWNHNVEYYKVARRAVGSRPSMVLDVGCGDGLLVQQLSSLGHFLTAIDIDEASIARARAAALGPNVDFILGDFMSHPFERSSFDAVVSVAALHHMCEPDALDRMADLLRPGGTLVVVGLARTRLPADLPWQLAGALTTRVLRRRHGGYRPVASPTLPPRHTYREIRDMATTRLPAARYRRHAMWRYSVVWRKPAASATDP
jgi:SAM-dependent methyltransferase